MPEYAELHASAHQVHRWSTGHYFTGVYSRSLERREQQMQSETAELLSRAVPAAASASASLGPLAQQLATSAHGRRLLEAMARKNARDQGADGGRAGTAIDVRALARVAGTEGMDRSRLEPRSRGKEVAVAIVPLREGEAVPAASEKLRCPTCAAAQRHDARLGRPHCEHGAPMALRRARSGKRFLACALPRKRACDAYLEEDKVAAPYRAAEDRWPPEGSVVITFRRGMSGRFQFVPPPGADHLPDGDDLFKAIDRSEREELWALRRSSLLRTYQVLFQRDDGAFIAFCDGRHKASDHAIWHVAPASALRRPPPAVICIDASDGEGDEADEQGRGGVWTAGRSPDPLYETALWKEKLRAQDFRDAAFDFPACEVLLDQSYFNGCGNWVRAEVLYRAKVPPFACTREVLRGAESRERLLDAVVAVLRQSVLCWQSGRRMVMKCYRRKYAARERDNLGRSIFYRGERGPLPGPRVRTDKWSRLAFYRVPQDIQRAEIEAHFCKFGRYISLYFNGAKRCGYVRFEHVQGAERAMEDYERRRRILFGGARLQYKERISRAKRVKPELKREPKEEEGPAVKAEVVPKEEGPVKKEEPSAEGDGPPAAAARIKREEEAVAMEEEAGDLWRPDLESDEEEEEEEEEGEEEGGHGEEGAGEPGKGEGAGKGGAPAAKAKRAAGGPTGAAQGARRARRRRTAR